MGKGSSPRQPTSAPSSDDRLRVALKEWALRHPTPDREILSAGRMWTPRQIADALDGAGEGAELFLRMLRSAADTFGVEDVIKGLDRSS